jgi:hypothetical protein
MKTWGFLLEDFANLSLEVLGKEYNEIQAKKNLNSDQ